MPLVAHVTDTNVVMTPRHRHLGSTSGLLHCVVFVYFTLERHRQRNTGDISLTKSARHNLNNVSLTPSQQCSLYVVLTKMYFVLSTLTNKEHAFIGV